MKWKRLNLIWIIPIWCILMPLGFLGMFFIACGALGQELFEWAMGIDI